MIEPSLRTADTPSDPNATGDHGSPASGAAAVFVPPAGPRYDLQEEIARGGMGVVWRANDRWLRREVAV